MILRTLSLSIGLAAILFASALANPIVLSNPYDVNSPNAFNSSRIEGDLKYLCYSDFYYDGSYEITDFHWTGMFGDNTLSHLDGFWFSIYNSNYGPIPGYPGSIAYSEFFSGNANATDNGDDFVFGQFSYDAYDFSVDLSTPWTGPVGTYYVSVMAEFSDFNAFFWGLSEAQYGADDLQFQNDETQQWNTLYTTGDLAWEVTGTVVPEPATMTLFGLGLLGAGLAARRNRKQ